MPRFDQPIEPMTLGKMRELGVSLAKWPDHWSHGPGCGRPNWKEQPQVRAWPGVPTAKQRETIVMILAIAAGAAALTAFAVLMHWLP